jgi:threonine dehydrogenase-like Zn-dependent dehydrogenase
VDAAGAPSLCATLLESKAAVGGTMALLARTEETAPLSSEHLITKNFRIVGSQGHSGESAFPRVIALMGAGRLQAGKLIKEVVSLEEALTRLERQKKCEGKILVQPNT